MTQITQQVWQPLTPFAKVVYNMRKIFFDKSITLPLFARRGDSGNSIVLRFFDEQGNEFPIDEMDWSLPIYKRGSDKPFLTLTEDNGGLELVGVNTLLIHQEAILEITPETYFYKLFSNEEVATWLNGELVIYGNLEKDTFENKKTIVVGGTTVDVSIVTGNIFVGTVPYIIITTSELEFDHNRDIIFVNEDELDDNVVFSFLNYEANRHFVLLIHAIAGITLEFPDFCTSKSAEWNGDTLHSFTITDDGNYTIEGIWDTNKFRLTLK